MITIRKALFSEIGEIYALRRSAAEDLTRRIGAAGDWSRVSVLPMVTRLFWGGPLCVVEKEREMAGTLTLDTRARDYYRADWFADPAAGAFYIRSFSVRPDMQGQGIGRAALEYSAQMARSGGLKALRTDTYEGAAGASGFYEKCGFTERRRFDDGGTRLVIYEKILGG